MATQYALDWTQKMPPEAQDAIRDGMQRADDHADGFWKAILAHCIWEAARKLPRLTVDDVLDQLDAVNRERAAKNQPPIDTHNLSALGPSMRRAGKEGIIKATTDMRRSQRPEKHGNLQIVWESKFYAGGKQ